MKTLAELAEIRKKVQAEMTGRDGIEEGNTRIVVGMATCGIAAGARGVLNAISSEILKRGLKQVKLTQTGCIGLCKYEPIVEVFEPGKSKVTYVKVTPESAVRIITEHIVNGKVINELMMQEEGGGK